MKNGELEGADIEKIYQLTTDKYKLGGKNILLYEDTFLLGNLMMRFDDASFVDRSSKSLVKKIKNNNFVFVPACQTIGDDNGHWTLFVYDRDNKIIHHYNSLNGINNLKYFRPLLKKIDELAQFGGEIIEHNTPQQNNGVDCGLYVIAITEFLVRRYRESSMVMNWEINNDEVREIEKNVPLFRKMLVEGKDCFTELATETTQRKSNELVDFILKSRKIGGGVIVIIIVLVLVILTLRKRKKIIL